MPRGVATELGLWQSPVGCQLSLLTNKHTKHTATSEQVYSYRKTSPASPGIAFIMDKSTVHCFGPITTFNARAGRSVMFLVEHMLVLIQRSCPVVSLRSSNLCFKSHLSISDFGIHHYSSIQKKDTEADSNTWYYIQNKPLRQGFVWKEKLQQLHHKKQYFPTCQKDSVQNAELRCGTTRNEQPWFFVRATLAQAVTVTGSEFRNRSEMSSLAKPL